MGEDEISEEIAKELASVEVQGSKVTEEVIQKTVNTEESILGTEEGVGKVIIASGSEESDDANATLSIGQVSTNDRVKVEAGEPLDRSSESDERIEEGSIKSEKAMRLLRVAKREMRRAEKEMLQRVKIVVRVKRVGLIRMLRWVRRVRTKKMRRVMKVT